MVEAEEVVVIVLVPIVAVLVVDVNAVGRVEVLVELENFVDVWLIPELDGVTVTYI